ncbi:MAG: hypothetical protein DF168_00902 [Candidatus Moanabacter tarae]|uniref:Uncharacterized protein n=1 Tax=Candidatus Moanibacter tarae TaxID=2200854 RepID=A0A2Z4AFF2_9BACT|nr:MAG: hypothetical protein DF168_00902 [Candidatus Moanabacter tarae]
MRTKSKQILTFVCLGILPLDGWAVRTSSFVDTSYEEFVLGEFNNVALSNSGVLKLAPSLDLLAKLDEPIVWVAASDQEGNLILGTGNYGKVLKVDSEGEVKTLFAPEEMLSRALAVAENGDIFVGTSPSGRVYRLPKAGRPEVYFDPPDSYIWAMTLDKRGNLYVATGNSAVVYMLPKDFQPNDTPTKWFACDQTHITSLGWDLDGNLLAGSSPGGTLYRIDSKGSGFALYNTGEQEIRQILVNDGGKIYFSTFSAGARGKKPITPQTQTKIEDDDTFTVTAKQFGVNGTNTLSQAASGSSTIYSLDQEGFVETYWGLPRAHVFSMIFSNLDELIIGTNDKGRLFSVRKRGEWNLLQQTPTGGEVSIIFPSKKNNGELFVITSNPAIIYRLKGSLAESGEYTSRVYDAKQIAKWGKILSVSENAVDSFGAFSTRTGNTKEPDATWGNWKSVDLTESGLLIKSPNGRYIQYRASFDHLKSGIENVRLFYGTKNFAPQLGVIRVIPVGFKLLNAIINPPNIDLDKLLDEKNPGRLIQTPIPRLKLKKRGEEGLLTVAWKSFDPNNDRLHFSLSIQNIKDSVWIKLAEKIMEPIITFNTNGFREGFYRVKIIASDEPDNGRDGALKGERLSEVFLIDNSPPRVELSGKNIRGNDVDFKFRSSDSFSIHREAWFSLDGQPPKLLRPTDGLFDSRIEDFNISIDALESGTHSLVLEVIDESGRSGILTVPFSIFQNE